jgi:hypothetical protein
VRKIFNCSGCSLAVTVQHGDTPTLSNNAFLYRCAWAIERRSHRETTVVIPQNCPHLQATLQQVGRPLRPSLLHSVAEVTTFRVAWP